jgi:hypothetical protein
MSQKKAIRFCPKLSPGTKETNTFYWLFSFPFALERKSDKHQSIIVKIKENPVSRSTKGEKNTPSQFLANKLTRRRGDEARGKFRSYEA